MAMHFLVSWDISSQGARWQEINNRLYSTLVLRNPIRPLNTVYLMSVSGPTDRKAIIDALNAVAATVTEQVLILATPLMVGGGYDGRQPPAMWEEINRRTL